MHQGNNEESILEYMCYSATWSTGVTVLHGAVGSPKVLPHNLKNLTGR